MTGERRSPGPEPGEPDRGEPGRVEPDLVEPDGVEPDVVDPTSVDPSHLDPTTLAPGALHVWVLDVTAPWLDELADSGVASERDRTRAAALTDRAMARALLARRAALRIVLGRYLDRDPASVDVVVAPGGKPVLLPPPDPARGRTLAFSVGHSGDLYGIAVSTSASVGFDVERRRTVARAEAIARRWFGNDEARSLGDLEGDELDVAFMRLWTAKEALAKRHGAGLRLMMTGDGAELDTRAARAEGRLRSFTPRPGYHAAVASTDAVDEIVVVRPEGDSWIT